MSEQTYGGHTADRLLEMRNAAPEDASVEEYYENNGEVWAQTASGVSEFYAAAYAAIPDLIARLRAAEARADAGWVGYRLGGVWQRLTNASWEGMVEDVATVPYDSEAVYDEQIAPLMAQIALICRQHGIPMIASFAYANDGTPSYVSTAVADDLVGARWPDRFERMYITLFCS